MSDCIIGVGRRTPKGYIEGQYWYPNKVQLHRKLHRYVYAKHHKHIFAPGEVVMHTCNNKECINIEHLKLGTVGENNVAAYKDGLRPTRKLTDEQVKEIRKKRKFYTNNQLAEIYSVSTSHISNILSNIRRTDV